MSRAKVKLAVVVLNWNGRQLLEEYLPYVAKHLPSYAQLIIGDNASTDDSLEYVRENFPEAEIIVNKGNYGFAKGYNELLKQIDAEYYALVNSDIETTEGWADEIISYMDDNTNVGACQPKILDHKSKDKYEYAGAAGGYIDFLGFPFCRGRVFNDLEQDLGKYNSVEEVFWATGACMFVRAEQFHEAEGFDEHFFAHMEEIDLCWRIQRMGFKICCVPSSTVYHLGGGTLKKLSPKKTYLNFRNNLSMLIKNLPTLKLLSFIVPKLMLDGIAAIKFLLEGSPLHTLSVLWSHVYMYWHLPRLLIQRWKLKRKYPYAKNLKIYQRPIVFDYYLLGKKSFSDLNWIKTKNT